MLLVELFDRTDISRRVVLFMILSDGMCHLHHIRVAAKHYEGRQISLTSSEVNSLAQSEVDSPAQNEVTSLAQSEVNSLSHSAATQLWYDTGSIARRLIN